MNQHLHKPVYALLALSLAVLACGPNADTSESGESGAPRATTASGGGGSSAGAVSSVEDVRDATVFIVAEGSLMEPGGAIPNAGWTGSGFIIDPSGLAVTNNHVVTGAARMKVYVSGEGEPYNARVLGVSECSDLAVIDIDGDGFPYLEWHDGPVNVGLEVYAAGFPLSDPEYTLTKGIVSKERADGDVPWASVDYVLEHDANIQPGNSGGPLVDADGQVVAINYAGGAQSGALASQFYAIAQGEALPVIDQLRQGEDVNSIGVNGDAFVDAESGFSGIWVASVASGSPADAAGIRAGDIISTMETISLGRAGTKGEYCDVLKSHSPDDTLALEVIRFATGEVLEGQLNGRELETSYVFDPNVGGNQGNTGGTASGYVDVSDAYSSIAVEIPAAWADTDGSAWMDGSDVIGAMVAAAPDLDAYLQTWTAPGMLFRVSDDLATLGGYVQVLDAWRPTYSGDCKLDGRYDYNDGFYRGKMDLFTNCGGPGGASSMVLAAVPTDNSQAFIVVLEMQWLTPEEEEVAVHALETFRVIGTLP
jgi:serine protease Do